MEFNYTVLDKSGKRLSAVAEADSIKTLIGLLKEKGMTPLRVTETKSRPVSRGRVRGMELALFSRQLSTILNAGILLTEALNTIAEDMDNAYFRTILKKIVAEITAGKSLSQALAPFRDVFPSIFTAVVKSGEEIGNLGKTIGGLAKYLENLERTKAKIKSALRYPMFLSSFLILVVSVIVLFLIPKFKDMFFRAGVKLPLLTRVVVSVSEFCLRNTVWLLCLIIILVVVFRWLLRLPAVRFSVDAFKIRAPFFGKIIRDALLARFCHTFSMLLAGGIRLPTALEVSAGVVDNVFLQQTIDGVRKTVIAGGSLSETMKRQPLFPRLVTRMAAVGEKSGRLDEMFARSAEYYDDNLKILIDNFSGLIEPVFIVTIGGVVLIVVLALYLPIFNISMAVH